MRVLKSDIKQRIKKDELLQAKIADATYKKFSSVKRWIEDDHIMLTTAIVLDVVREHFDLSKNIELTVEVTNKKRATI